MCVLFAATYPERTRALVLYGTLREALRPRRRLPVGADLGRARSATRDELEADVGRERRHLEDVAERGRRPTRWFQRRGRAVAEPGGCARPDPHELEGRRPGRAAHVQCPTLVLHRSGDRDSHVEEGRYIADRIPGARFVELRGRRPRAVRRPGPDPRRGRGVPHGRAARRREPDRVLATVLFTDLVGSTETARGARGRGVGDARSRAHNARCARELARFAGEEIDTAGDGFLALFDGPARAIRCALADPRGAAARSASRCAPACTRARSSVRRRQASRHRRARRRTRHVARGRGRGARERDDARPRRPAPGSSSRTAASTS